MITMRPDGEYRESRPGDTWPANHPAMPVPAMRMHVPVPAEDGPYDTCRGCGVPIVQHWDNRELWVGMTGGSAECCGRSR